ncbi:hypothetical protein CkaCkLH20_08759 [Colletotrichum karsti]|uniref:26S proteasome complex subunit SEM1 n=1 Tax=Colletotrichum karsti TaxID=1095194 RepID=A0A9P6HZR1_9PEZI|nr:uncharacterized protein CkaCkLH20_08759 [Colletotrichum karsti]KAF9873649.1 hypothetical protein CkaCkLH20_08759 [Colletotrichum karsti]
MASSDAKPAQDKAAADAKAEETTQQQAAAAKKPALGEDDEFEDFPVDVSHLPENCEGSGGGGLYTHPKGTDGIVAPGMNWAQEDTEAAAGGSGTGTTQHLWEESWDDDDTSDDFSAQLKEELKKVDANKRR